MFEGQKEYWKREDVKQQRSEWLSNWYKNPENRKKQSEEQLKNGYRHPEEVKKLLSEMRSGEGNTFYGKSHKPETKKLMAEKQTGELNHNYGKPPSKETREKLSAYRGEQAPVWKGGRSTLQQLIRANTRYLEWRTAIYKRDDYRDWFSGVRGNGDLQVHHIIPFSKLLDKYNIKTIDDAINCAAFWDLNNGMTMLKSSHRAYHQMWGKNPEVATL